MTDDKKGMVRLPVGVRKKIEQWKKRARLVIERDRLRWPDDEPVIAFGKQDPDGKL